MRYCPWPNQTNYCFSSSSSRCSGGSSHELAWEAECCCYSATQNPIFGPKPTFLQRNSKDKNKQIRFGLIWLNNQIIISDISDEQAASIQMNASSIQESTNLSLTRSSTLLMPISFHELHRSNENFSFFIAELKVAVLASDTTP